MGLVLSELLPQAKSLLGFSELSVSFKKNPILQIFSSLMVTFQTDGVFGYLQIVFQNSTPS